MNLHERKATVRQYLLTEPHRSDRAIAAAIGCNRELVGRIRAELVAAGQIEVATIRGRDGHVYRDKRRGKPMRDRVLALQQRADRLLEAMRAESFPDQWRASKVSTRRRLAASVLQLNLEASKLRRIAP